MTSRNTSKPDRRQKARRDGDLFRPTPTEDSRRLERAKTIINTQAILLKQKNEDIVSKNQALLKLRGENEAISAKLRQSKVRGLAEGGFLSEKLYTDKDGNFIDWTNLRDAAHGFAKGGLVTPCRPKLKPFMHEDQTELSKLKAQVAQHQVELENLSTEAQVGRSQRQANYRSLRSSIEALESLVGPGWQTAQGHIRPLRSLSTSHLTNILEGNFGSPSIREEAQEELSRRSIDETFRAEEGPYRASKIWIDGKLYTREDK